MNESILKALIKKGAPLDIVVVHVDGLRFNMLIDSEPLLSQKGGPRIFRLQSAADYLEGLGIKRFVVDL